MNHHSRCCTAQILPQLWHQPRVIQHRPSQHFLYNNSHLPTIWNPPGSICKERWMTHIMVTQALQHILPPGKNVVWIVSLLPHMYGRRSSVSRQQDFNAESIWRNGFSGLVDCLYEDAEIEMGWGSFLTWVEPIVIKIRNGCGTGTRKWMKKKYRPTRFVPFIDFHRQDTRWHPARPYVKQKYYLPTEP